VGLADKQIASVSAHVRELLEPDEREVAVLGQGMAGSSIWLVALISPLLAFLQTPYGVVVTDRRVFVVRLAKKMTGYPPKTVEGLYAAADVSAEYQGGAVTGTLHLRPRDGQPLKLSIQTIYKAGAQAVAAALN
jgi:hypothetical protein